jgi:hypothetical protein
MTLVADVTVSFVTDLSPFVQRPPRLHKSLNQPWRRQSRHVPARVVRGLVERLHLIPWQRFEPQREVPSSLTNLYFTRHGPRITMNRRLNFQWLRTPSFFATPMENGSQERRNVKILKI